MKRSTYMTPATVVVAAILVSVMMAVSAPSPRESLVDRHHRRYDSVIAEPTDAPFDAPGETYTCLTCHAVGADGTGFLVERQCRVCHDQERHHILYGSKIPLDTDAPYGAFGESYACLSCHAIDDASGTVRFPIERNCHACHGAPDFIDLLVDIRPQTYPNPINIGSGGVLPVAVLGAAGYDVTEIDVSSLRLAERVAPLHWHYREGGDGSLDLMLLFSTKAVVSTLRNPAPGRTYELWITGMLYDGIYLQGSDTVVMVARRSLRSR